MSIIKRFEFDKRYLKMSLYALGVIILAITFEHVIKNFKLIKESINTLTSLLSPFIIGLFMAYLINPLIRFLENKAFKNLESKKTKRGLSLTLAYLLVFTLIIWLISYLIPEMINNILSLFKAFPSYLEALKVSVYSFLDEHPSISYDIEGYINSIFDTIIAKSSSISSVLNSTLTYFISGTVSFASKVLDFVLGIIISIYVLADKERFARQSKKLIYTLLSEKTANKTMKIIYDSNRVFEGFLVGKIIDSSIIGVICFVGLAVFKVPYTLLISIIIGITNMIPYFGPFIGAVPAIFITIAAAGPLSALWIAIFILILQQFDGNILGPKILGDSTGLTPFWIIFSITIGGALAGVLGMFIGVPVFAVIYTMFGKFIDRKYNEKTEINLKSKENNQ